MTSQVIRRLQVNDRLKLLERKEDTMKKMLALLCALSFGLTLVACGGGNKAAKTEDGTAAAAGEMKAEEGAADEGATKKKSLKKNEGNRMERSEGDE